MKGANAYPPDNPGASGTAAEMDTGHIAQKGTTICSNPSCMEPFARQQSRWSSLEEDPTAGHGPSCATYQNRGLPPRCVGALQRHFGAFHTWTRPLTAISFDQCRLGQLVKKATTLATDLPIQDWDQMRCTHQ